MTSSSSHQDIKDHDSSTSLFSSIDAAVTTCEVDSVSANLCSNDLLNLNSDINKTFQVGESTFLEDTDKSIDQSENDSRKVNHCVDPEFIVNNISSNTALVEENSFNSESLDFLEFLNASADVEEKTFQAPNANRVNFLEMGDKPPTEDLALSCPVVDQYDDLVTERTVDVSDNIFLNLADDASKQHVPNNDHTTEMNSSALHDVIFIQNDSTSPIKDGTSSNSNLSNMTNTNSAHNCNHTNGVNLFSEVKSDTNQENLIDWNSFLSNVSGFDTEKNSSHTFDTFFVDDDSTSEIKDSSEMNLLLNDQKSNVVFEDATNTYFSNAKQDLVMSSTDGYCTLHESIDLHAIDMSYQSLCPSFSYLNHDSLNKEVVIVLKNLLLTVENKRSFQDYQILSDTSLAKDDIIVHNNACMSASDVHVLDTDDSEKLATLVSTEYTNTTVMQEQKSFQNNFLFDSNNFSPQELINQPSDFYSEQESFPEIGADNMRLLDQIHSSEMVAENKNFLDLDFATDNQHTVSQSLNCFMSAASENKIVTDFESINLSAVSSSNHNKLHEVNNSSEKVSKSVVVIDSPDISTKEPDSPTPNFEKDESTSESGGSLFDSDDMNISDGSVNAEDDVKVYDAASDTSYEFDDMSFVAASQPSQVTLERQSLVEKSLLNQSKPQESITSNIIPTSVYMSDDWSNDESESQSYQTDYKLFVQKLQLPSLSEQSEEFSTYQDNEEAFDSSWDDIQYYKPKVDIMPMILEVPEDLFDFESASNSTQSTEEVISITSDSSRDSIKQISSNSSSCDIEYSFETDEELCIEVKTVLNFILQRVDEENFIDTCNEKLVICNDVEIMEVDKALSLLSQSNKNAKSNTFFEKDIASTEVPSIQKKLLLPFVEHYAINHSSVNFVDDTSGDHHVVDSSILTVDEDKTQSFTLIKREPEASLDVKYNDVKDTAKADFLSFSEDKSSVKLSNVATNLVTSIIDDVTFQLQKENELEHYVSVSADKDDIDLPALMTEKVSENAFNHVIGENLTEKSLLESDKDKCVSVISLLDNNMETGKRLEKNFEKNYTSNFDQDDNNLVDYFSTLTDESNTLTTSMSDTNYEIHQERLVSLLEDNSGEITISTSEANDCLDVYSDIYTCETQSASTISKSDRNYKAQDEDQVISPFVFASDNMISSTLLNKNETDSQVVNSFKAYESESKSTLSNSSTLTKVNDEITIPHVENVPTNTDDERLTDQQKVKCPPKKLSPSLVSLSDVSVDVNEELKTPFMENICDKVIALNYSKDSNHLDDSSHISSNENKTESSIFKSESSDIEQNNASSFLDLLGDNTSGSNLIDENQTNSNVVDFFNTLPDQGESELLTPLPSSKINHCVEVVLPLLENNTGNTNIESRKCLQNAEVLNTSSLSPSDSMSDLSPSDSMSDTNKTYFVENQDVTSNSSKNNDCMIDSSDVSANKNEVDTSYSVLVTSSEGNKKLVTSLVDQNFNKVLKSNSWITNQTVDSFSTSKDESKIEIAPSCSVPEEIVMPLVENIAGHFVDENVMSTSNVECLESNKGLPLILTSHSNCASSNDLATPLNKNNAEDEVIINLLKENQTDVPLVDSSSFLEVESTFFKSESFSDIPIKNEVTSHVEPINNNVILSNRNKKNLEIPDSCITSSDKSENDLLDPYSNINIDRHEEAVSVTSSLVIKDGIAADKESLIGNHNVKSPIEDDSSLYSMSNTNIEVSKDSTLLFAGNLTYGDATLNFFKSDDDILDNFDIHADKPASLSNSNIHVNEELIVSPAEEIAKNSLVSAFSNENQSDVILDRVKNEKLSVYTEGSINNHEVVVTPLIESNVGTDKEIKKAESIDNLSSSLISLPSTGSKVGEEFLNKRFSDNFAIANCLSGNNLIDSSDVSIVKSKKNVSVFVSDADIELNQELVLPLAEQTSTNTLVSSLLFENQAVNESAESFETFAGEGKTELSVLCSNANVYKEVVSSFVEDNGDCALNKSFTDDQNIQSSKEEERSLLFSNSDASIDLVMPHVENVSDTAAEFNSLKIDQSVHQVQNSSNTIFCGNKTESLISLPDTKFDGFEKVVTSLADHIVDNAIAESLIYSHDSKNLSLLPVVEPQKCNEESVAPLVENIDKSLVTGLSSCKDNQTNDYFIDSVDILGNENTFESSVSVLSTNEKLEEANSNDTNDDASLLNFVNQTEENHVINSFIALNNKNQTLYGVKTDLVEPSLKDTCTISADENKSDSVISNTNNITEVDKELVMQSANNPFITNSFNTNQIEIQIVEPFDSCANKDKTESPIPCSFSNINVHKEEVALIEENNPGNVIDKSLTDTGNQVNKTPDNEKTSLSLSSDTNIEVKLVTSLVKKVNEDDIMLNSPENDDCAIDFSDVPADEHKIEGFILLSDNNADILKKSETPIFEQNTDTAVASNTLSENQTNNFVFDSSNILASKTTIALSSTDSNVGVQKDLVTSLLENKHVLEENFSNIQLDDEMPDDPESVDFSKNISASETEITAKHAIHDSPFDPNCIFMNSDVAENTVISLFEVKAESNLTNEYSDENNRPISDHSSCEVNSSKIMKETHDSSVDRFEENGSAEPESLNTHAVKVTSSDNSLMRKKKLTLDINTSLDLDEASQEPLRKSRRDRHDTIGSIDLLSDSEDDSFVNSSTISKTPDQDLDVLVSLDEEQSRHVTVPPALNSKRRSLVPPSSLVLSVALDELQVQTPVVSPSSDSIIVGSVIEVDNKIDEAPKTSDAFTVPEIRALSRYGVKELYDDLTVKTASKEENPSPFVPVIPLLSPPSNIKNSITWEKVVINNVDYDVDHSAIQPYKQVISHGGFYKEKNTIVEIFGRYLPESNVTNYTWVIDNLFLYMLSTIELLVQDQEFVVVFFCNSMSKNQFPSTAWLKKSHSHISKLLRKNLKGFYIVQSTFYMKTVINFTRMFLNRKAFKKIKHVKNHIELKQFIPIDFLYVPEDVVKILK